MRSLFRAIRALPAEDWRRAAILSALITLGSLTIKRKREIGPF